MHGSLLKAAVLMVVAVLTGCGSASIKTDNPPFIPNPNPATLPIECLTYLFI
jgi:hypothetical protein